MVFYSLFYIRSRRTIFNIIYFRTLDVSTCGHDRRVRRSTLYANKTRLLPNKYVCWIIYYIALFYTILWLDNWRNSGLYIQIKITVAITNCIIDKPGHRRPRIDIGPFLGSIVIPPWTRDGPQANCKLFPPSRISTKAAKLNWNCQLRETYDYVHKYLRKHSCSVLSLPQSNRTAIRHGRRD